MELLPETGSVVQVARARAIKAVCLAVRQLQRKLGHDPLNPLGEYGVTASRVAQLTNKAHWPAGKASG